METKEKMTLGDKIIWGVIAFAVIYFDGHIIAHLLFN